MIQRITNLCRRGRRNLIITTALSGVLCPRPGMAGARDKDVLLGAAQAKFDELATMSCESVDAAQSQSPERLQLAAANLQLAQVYDFHVRNFSETGPNRPGRMYYYVNQAVVSYERSHACHPNVELLRAAISLVNVALADLKQTPTKDPEKWHHANLALLDRLVKASASAPPNKPDCTCPPPPSRRKAEHCEGPPPVAQPRGCSLGVESSRWCGAVILLVALARRRRRRARERRCVAP